MVKGQEEKLCEEQLKSLGLFSLEKTEGRPQCGVQRPHNGNQSLYSGAK